MPLIRRTLAICLFGACLVPAGCDRAPKQREPAEDNAPPAAPPAVGESHPVDAADPARALELARSGPEPAPSPDALARAAAEAVAGKGSNEARAGLQELKTAGEKEAFLSTLVPLWAEKAPQDCVSFLASLPADSHRARWLGEGLALFAEQDPAKAAEMLLALLTPQQAPGVYARLTAAWVARDPAMAVAWAEGLRENDPGQRILVDAVAAWAELDPAAALKYVSESANVEDHLIEPAVRVAAIALAEQDGPSAVRWALEQQAEGEAGDPLEMVLSTWAAKDPPAAARSAMEDVPASHRAVAVEAVALGWSDANPKRALAWAKTLPPESPGAKEALKIAADAMEDASRQD